MGWWHQFVYHLTCSKITHFLDWLTSWYHGSSRLNPESYQSCQRDAVPSVRKATLKDVCISAPLPTECCNVNTHFPQRESNSNVNNQLLLPDNWHIMYKVPSVLEAILSASIFKVYSIMIWKKEPSDKGMDMPQPSLGSISKKPHWPSEQLCFTFCRKDKSSEQEKRNQTRKHYARHGCVTYNIPKQ